MVESEEGVKVLFIQSCLASELEGMVFDHLEIQHVAGFTISKLTFH